MSDELKPCPFCRSTPLVQNHQGSAIHIGCRCGIQMWGAKAHFGTEAAAIEAWNTRAQPSDGALANEGAEPVAKCGALSLNNIVCSEPSGHDGPCGIAPATASAVLPEGFMIVERGIWTEEQVDSAAKCIELLKDVPGMRARDLAIAAMDAGQCKAPDITLADFACLDRVKELNP